MDATDVQSQHGPDGSSSTERDEARQRLRARRDFSSHLVAYVVVNGFLIAIWAMTGAGYFWPAWLLGTWAIGLVLHAWDAFGRRSITEADVDAELLRRRSER
jgi:hypothetical protein